MLTDKNYLLDTSSSNAFQEIIENKWDFQIYSVSRDYVISASADELFEFFMDAYPGANYRIFYGSRCIIYTDDFTIRFSGKFHDDGRTVKQRWDDDIVITGRIDQVKEAFDKFDEFFEDRIIADHHNVDMVVRSQGGLDYITLPIKTNRKIHPEMYPIIDNLDDWISGFFESTANSLILIGDPGAGKSALINEIILRARKTTQVVFDKEVMKTDQLYTNFINKTMREDGGLMVMEDADTILTERVVTNNETMSRLLNLSDGIVDTSGAKFIFSANISNKEDIDKALTRPGRCYDIVEFRPLTRAEAEVAAKAVGRELQGDKDEYTVAEIYTQTPNRVEKKRKVGFI